jgi:tellurite resistance protein TerC
MDPNRIEDPRVLIALLFCGGALLIGLLAWRLVPPRAWSPLADEIGELAWIAMRHVRRVFVSMSAVTLALVGVALLFLPGPGMLFLAAALGLLATEFVWARRWLERLRGRFEALGEDARGLLEGHDRRPPD